MVLERLPERARTPAAARAMTSPSAVLLAGAAMSGGVLAGVPIVAAAGLGALAWGVRVWLALPRSTKERVQPMALAEPWRHFVREALAAKERFDSTVRRTRPGPLRETLVNVGRRLDQGVTECWRVARQGDALESGLRQLDVEGARAELAQVQAEQAASEGPARVSLDRAAEAVRAQLASAERLQRVSADARNRLRALNAQLDEAVARAVELSLSAGDVSQVSPLSADVDSLVGELESLRQALEETSGAAPPAGTA